MNIKLIVIGLFGLMCFSINSFAMSSFPQVDACNERNHNTCVILIELYPDIKFEQLNTTEIDGWFDQATESDIYKFMSRITSAYGLTSSDISVKDVSYEFNTITLKMPEVNKKGLDVLRWNIIKTFSDVWKIDVRDERTLDVIHFNN
jgi:hypothetical protein